MPWEPWDFLKKTREIHPPHQDTVNDTVAHTKLKVPKFRNPKGSKFPKPVKDRRMN